MVKSDKKNGKDTKKLIEQLEKQIEEALAEKEHLIRQNAYLLKQKKIMKDAITKHERIEEILERQQSPIKKTAGKTSKTLKYKKRTRR